MQRAFAVGLSFLSLTALARPAAAQEKPEEGKPEPPGPATEPGKDIKVDDKHEEGKKEEEPGPPGPARASTEAASEPPRKIEEDDPEKKFTLSGYLEAYYAYNFNNPGNGITNYRGYDTRHNAFTISNAVLDAGFRAKNLLARLALQIGHTPATYYSQEPSLGGSDGAGSSDPGLWQYLQRASVGWQVTKPLLLEAGLFLTNFTLEGITAKDNWNWSRSIYSTRLPNYVTGVRATLEPVPRWTLNAGVYNGWNTIVDDNDEKSVSAGAQYKVKEILSVSATYFGGVERRGGAPEGRAWRHLLAVNAQVSVHERVELAVEGVTGGEDNHYGFQWFAGGGVFGRLKTFEWLYVAARGDALWEDPSASAAGTAEQILIPAKRVVSATATLDARPLKGLSLRIEGRRDMASTDLFFRSSVAGDGTTTLYVTNAKTQTTLLGGVTAWF